MSKVTVFVALLVLSGLFIFQRYSYSQKCANTLSCKESLSLKVENGSKGTFGGKAVVAPGIDLAVGKIPDNVLGEAVGVSGEKHIYVDLTTQTLKAFQGDTLYMEASVSTGKWYPTPTGDFSIWEKVRATRMTGGEGADYYDLPNVPYDMFFSGSGVSAGRGFAIHGAYWHNNFGHPMSHGCINMRTVDAERLFYWADAGTKITIYGQAAL